MKIPRLRARLTAGEWILLVACLGTIGSQALVPRDLSRGEALMLASLEGEYAGYVVSRVVTGVVLLMSGIGLLLAARRRGLSTAGVGLLLPYGAWFVGNFVLNAIGRETPEGWLRTFHQVPVVAALLLTAPPDLPRAIRTVKLLLLAFVYAAIVGAVIAPELAVARSYDGLIPGLDIRLYGIGGGAITLGSLALMFVMLELAEPAAGKLRYLHLVAAAGVFVAAQVKTAWIFSLVAAWMTATALAEKRILGLRRARLLGPLQWVALGFALVAFWTFSDRLGTLFDFAPGEVAANLTTFTGRTWIWQVSIEAFLDNPWFGYGPKLWADPEFLARHGEFAHCHNQVLQSLASAGVVGAAGLAVYLFALGRRALHAMPVSLAPVIVLASILFLGITDVPLRSEYVLDQYFLMHGIMLMTLLASASAVRARARRHGAGSFAIVSADAAPDEGPADPRPLGAVARRLTEDPPRG